MIGCFNSYQTNKPFMFDDLEITISNQIEFAKIENSLDKNFGKDVIKIPITVKNKTNEIHNRMNPFFYKVFFNGISLENEDVFFGDSALNANDLSPKASYITYAYYLYAGDGTYTIELKDFNKTINIEFEVKK